MTDYKPARRAASGFTSPDVKIRRWIRPTVSKMRAGDAEVGPNPDNADGPFSFS